MDRYIVSFRNGRWRSPPYVDALAFGVSPGDSGHWGPVEQIQCRTLSGGTRVKCSDRDGKVDELGLYGTLVRAHELRGIDDASPLVTVAPHRLLLAILYRTFGIESGEDWKQLWSAGYFDPARVDAYLREKHTNHERFELFDPERPFY